MRKFVYLLIIFLLPILTLLLVIEIDIRGDNNSFKIKAQYQKNNYEQIETLILGTSHSYGGINPEYLSLKTSNLAFDSQDVKIDSALFFHYVKDMKKLKNLIIELDYHRMEIEQPKDYFRLSWYYIFHDIEISPTKLHKTISLYASNPTFFNIYIKKRLKSNYKKKEINKYGFVKKNYTHFIKLKYDSIKIYKTAPKKLTNRHKQISKSIFTKNRTRIDAIINYCENNNISVFLTATPVHEAYVKEKILIKERRRVNYIDSLKNNTNITYLNYEKSELFFLRDFSNYDHLNTQGAKKYTILIDSIILKKKRDDKIY